MGVRTEVIWTDEARATVQPVATAEVNILVQQGKTDGNVEVIAGPNPDQVTVHRTWIDLQNAEDWLVFVNALEVPPVSTAILPD
jgi:hypothetical protein